MKNNTKQALIDLFEKWAGENYKEFTELPPSGSYREYYRITSENNSVIGVYNSDKKENIAFLTFTDHFYAKGLAVPKILSIDEENDIYLEEDLGDTTLFKYLTDVREGENFPEELVGIYKKVLTELPKFQIEAGTGLNYDVCYPRASFDKQSMMWDLNYFKYYFLKLAKIHFDEQALENDYQVFTDYLLKAETKYFLYRDFQSRNIMLKDGEPYFIDYQGGRKGALHYDLASLLFDGKADIPHNVRSELLHHYMRELKKHIDFDEASFLQFYYGYVLIRIMQAMGAYGFRGFYEKKEHFLASIPFAIENLKWLLSVVSLPIEIPTLISVLESLTESEELKKFGKKKKTYNLNLKISSFSYKKGLPADDSGNGGGYIFDCRAIHNPGRYDQYKLLTGKDAPVIRFLEEDSKVDEFLEHVYALVENQIKVYQARKFTNLMVSFGCTGGQHRSVYCAEKLANYLKEIPNLNIDLSHREQD